jgi:(1->4)-alpha-D-glucan 1-alpha-D-glucosylmutase
VRARLDVLSELPEEWARRVAGWRRLNLANKRTVRGRRAPDPGSVYHFLQAMVGLWPSRPPGADELEELRSRLTAYALKAAREAKDRTSWTDPDEEFEAALAGSVEALLSPDRSFAFLEDLQSFVGRIAGAGRWNALSRTLLHLTSPGVPDLYQGDELWNLALVDPDNRRPVDFVLRQALLDEVERRFEEGGDERDRLLAELMSSTADGRIKLHVIRCTLQARRRRPELQMGDYHPLLAEGSSAGNVVTFARVAGGSFAVIAVPRLLAAKLPGDRLPTDPELWRGTGIRIPVEWPTRWTCALSGASVTVSDSRLVGEDLFRRLPLALLLAEGSP